MTVYKLTSDEISKVPETSFQALGLTERNDLQRLLRDSIEIIAPDCLVVSEEFGRWEESKRRIDLLAVDQRANLVVIELKRTEDGGHMDLQAIRYAAMVSAFSFSDIVEIYGQYIQKRNLDVDPTESLLTFLNWDEPDEESFASNVRIILSAADFSKELINSVIWLNDSGDLDIRCVRIKPYGTNDNVLLDVQRIIPLPEAEEYQERLKAKKQVERQQKRQYDRTQYDVICNGQPHKSLGKRRAILQIVTFLASVGHGPAELNEYLNQQTPKSRLNFFSIEEQLDSEEMETFLSQQEIDISRYLTKDDELIKFEGQTYAISNQWGLPNFSTVTQHLLSKYSSAGLSMQESNS